MKAFVYQVLCQCKWDLRNTGILLTYYVVPFLFFLFMSGIFLEITPTMKDTLISSMIIFTVSMGSLLGTSVLFIELYTKEVRNTYKIGNIPLYSIFMSVFTSSFIHLCLISTIIYLCSMLLFDARIPVNPYHSILFILYIIGSILLGMILGMLCKNSTQTTMFSQLLFLPSLMLSGIMFPTELLPTVFQEGSKIYLATHIFVLVNQSTITIESLLYFSSILLIIVGIFVGVLRFKMK